MKKYSLIFAFALFSSLGSAHLHSQEIGRFSGNFQLEAQTYTKDSLIEAEDVSEKMLSNGFFKFELY